MNRALHLGPVTINQLLNLTPFLSPTHFNTNHLSDCLPWNWYLRYVPFLINRSLWLVFSHLKVECWISASLSSFHSTYIYQLPKKVYKKCYLNINCIFWACKTTPIHYIFLLELCPFLWHGNEKKKKKRGVYFISASELQQRSSAFYLGIMLTLIHLTHRENPLSSHNSFS